MVLRQCCMFCQHLPDIIEFGAENLSRRCCTSEFPFVHLEIDGSKEGNSSNWQRFWNLNKWKMPTRECKISSIRKQIYIPGEFGGTSDPCKSRCEGINSRVVEKWRTWKHLLKCEENCLLAFTYSLRELISAFHTEQTVKLIYSSRSIVYEYTIYYAT